MPAPPPPPCSTLPLTSSNTVSMINDFSLLSRWISKMFLVIDVLTGLQKIILLILKSQYACIYDWMKLYCVVAIIHLV